MSRDPNGVYSLPPSYFVQTGDTILPVQHNPVFESVANALTNSIARDGRTVMTGNLQMGGNKVTNIAPGTNDGDALNVLQLWDRVDAVADFATVADMLADNSQRIGYAGSGARVVVSPGQIITAQGFRYEVAASDAAEFDEETAGGVKLVKLPELSEGELDTSFAPTQGEGFVWSTGPRVFEEAPPGSSDFDKVTPGGVKLYRQDLRPLVVGVGPGGDFASINDALTYLSNYNRGYKAGGVTADILLLSGFVMAEQVDVKGIDFGWVTIGSEDAEVMIDREAITSLKGTNSYPAFYFDNGCVAPIIGTLFDMSDTGLGNYRIALHYRNARGFVLQGAGCKNPAYRGLYITSGSVVRAPQTIWSGCKSIGDSDGAGCRASDSGFAAIQQVDCTNSAGDGISINGAWGFVHKADLSGSARHGLYAAAGAHVSAFELTAENCGNHALNAEGAFVSAHSSTLSSFADAVRASDNSVVNVRSSTGVSVGSGRGITALHGANVNARASTFRGILAQYGAEISGFGGEFRIDPENPSALDIRVMGGGIIMAHNSTGGVSQTVNQWTTDGYIGR